MLCVQQKLQKEQEELARKQREDLERERKPADNTSAQDQVAEAWRKAQQEAAPRRGKQSGRHSGRHGGSQSHCGGAASNQPVVAGVRESSSHSRSPQRDGAVGAHEFVDREIPGGHARVGFAGPRANIQGREQEGYGQGPSGHHAGFQREFSAAQRPLHSHHPGFGPSDEHVSDAVVQKLEQVCGARISSFNLFEICRVSLQEHVERMQQIHVNVCER
jgi:hypothetical protein